VHTVRFTNFTQDKRKKVIKYFTFV